MLITENSIEAILDMANIEDVISRFVSLKKKGANLIGCCPFHDEKTGSFTVSPAKQIYKCFGCGKAGNVVKFLMDKESLSYPDALKYLADHYHITIEYEEQTEKQKEASNKAQDIQKVLNEANERYFIPNRKHEAFINYFKERNISDETLIEWGIGYAPYDFKGLVNLFLREGKFGLAEDGGICVSKAEQCYDVLINRITIPIRLQNGNIVGFAGRYIGDDKNQAKYINPKDTYLYNKNRVLFGLDRAAKAIQNMGFAILTEGYFDVIGLHTISLLNTVASCGTALTDLQIGILSRYTSDIYLMYDGDKAGKKAQLKSIGLLLKHFNVSVIKLPENTDPFDWSQTTRAEEAPDELNKLKMDAIVWAYESLTADLNGEDIDKKDKIIGQVCEMLNQVSSYKQSELIKILAKISQTKADVWKKRCAELNKSIVKTIKEGVTGKELLPKEADESEFEQYGFFQYKGQYWGMTANGGKYAVSNFVMEILFHVKTGGEEAFRLVKVKNIHGFEAVINMNTDDFVSLSSFKKLIARRGNYLWKGKEEDLTKLQDKLQREERPTELVDVLGYHPRGNFYAFSNGLIDLDELVSGGKQMFKPVDEYGIVNHLDRNYFIPASSKMYADKEDLFYNYKKFTYISRDLKLIEWFKLFDKVYPENGKIGFVFLVASLFSDIVYKQMGRRFPLLSLYGQRGSGKGTFAESLLCLFGQPQEQIMLGGNTTQVGFMRTFAQFRNAVVWLDEYKNNLNKRVIEAIKNIYDRIGYKRGKKDHSFEVDYVPVQSAAFISGQEMPTIEPALFTRVIMLSFKETKHNEESRNNYRLLMGEQEKGLSHLTVYLLQYRHFISENFRPTFEAEVKAIEKALNNASVEERMINNYACLSAMCKLILDKETLGFRHYAFRDLLVKNLSSQHAVLEGSDDTTKFWQVVESLFNQNLIREEHDFKLEDRKLYIRIQNIAGLYEKEMRMRNDPNTLQKSTLENYLQIDKSKFICRTKKKFDNGSYTHCMVFNYQTLDINLIKKHEGMSNEDVAMKYHEMGINLDDDSPINLQGSLNLNADPTIDNLPF